MTGPILVTGATGFVGQAVTRDLLDHGHHVVAMLRAGSRPLAFSSPALAVIEHPGTASALARLLQSVRPAAAVHLAALFVSLHTADHVEQLITSNVTLTAQLAEALVAANCRRLVCASTSWQHFDSSNYRPVNLYAATKQAADDILRYYADAHGLAVASVRLGDTYGPGDTRGKLISLILRAAATGAPLDLSPGDQLLDLVHSTDVAAAIRSALHATATPTHGFTAYSANADRQVSLKELVAIAESALGRPIAVRFGSRPYRPREVMHPSFPDPRPPGWNPAIDLPTGLRRLGAQPLD